MAMVSFSENHEGLLVAFDEGKSLASMSDPRLEGLKWAYSWGEIPTPEVVVIGLGSGFHVAALADIERDLKISVIETREALIPVFRAQFPELSERVEVIILATDNDIFKTDIYSEVLKRKSCVLSCLESWGSRSSLFTKIFAHLTGRSLESLAYHFEGFGIDMKALYTEGGRLLNIKDILPKIEHSNLSEKNRNIFKVLGELVK